MRRYLVATLLISLQAASAFAGVEPVRDVKSASAQLSADGRAVVVNATVDLSNGCLSDPRIQTPAAGAQPDADGVVSLDVIIDSNAGPGIACPMIYRSNVPANPLTWKDPPHGLKAIRLIGTRTPALAPVAAPGGPG